jgi:hypothetical protein
MKAAEALEDVVECGMDNTMGNKSREQDRLVSAKMVVA